jgi:hypothetical protein
VPIHTLTLTCRRSVFSVMNSELPTPDPLWNTVPPRAQVARPAAGEILKARIVAFDSRVRNLKARLKLNATKSPSPFLPIHWGTMASLTPRTRDQVAGDDPDIARRSTLS